MEIIRKICVTCLEHSGPCYQTTTGAFSILLIHLLILSEERSLFFMPVQAQASTDQYQILKARQPSHWLCPCKCCPQRRGKYWFWGGDKRVNIFPLGVHKLFHFSVLLSFNQVLRNAEFLLLEQTCVFCCECSVAVINTRSLLFILQISTFFYAMLQTAECVVLMKKR